MRNGRIDATVQTLADMKAGATHAVDGDTAQ